ncbi:hypothetical protein FF38_00694 [Lucilia cuprina]|uniref:Uncharacterized protein n=1 Tax=Lucilia cuprina TaxID=7375 RepID=A0A0L0BPY4_LUCCU|nr:hypothetical protein FF38_00694 [Lucilia cuprina]
MLKYEHVTGEERKIQEDETATVPHSINDLDYEDYNCNVTIIISMTIVSTLSLKYEYEFFSKCQKSSVEEVLKMLFAAADDDDDENHTTKTTSPSMNGQQQQQLKNITSFSSTSSASSATSLKIIVATIIIINTQHQPLPPLTKLKSFEIAFMERE